MPKYIAKLKEDGYVEWSTIVDAPVTYILTREHMLAHLDAEYGRSSFEGNRERLDRADKYGTSCIDTNFSLEELLLCNRAGDKTRSISLKKILQKYDLKQAKDT